MLCPLQSFEKPDGARLVESRVSRSNPSVRRFRLIKPDGEPVRYFEGQEVVFFDVREASRWQMPGWRVEEIKGRHGNQRES